MVLFVLTLTLFCELGCSSSSSFSAQPTTGAAPNPSVSIAAGTTSLQIGNRTTFTANVSVGAGGDGSWSVSGGDVNGTIDSKGVYQTPPSLPTPNIVTICFALNGSVYSAPLRLMNPPAQLLTAVPSVLSMLSTSIVLTGTGFTPETNVSVDGVAVTATYVNAQQVTIPISIGSASTSISVSASNPDQPVGPDSALVIPVILSPLTITPATLTGGDVSLSVAGSGFTAKSIVTIDGKELTTTFISSSTLMAHGYLPPWRDTSASIGVALESGATPVVQQAVPIAPTAVTYDTASRFATQAAFGPRHDVIEHIQQIGLDPFITEQMQQPPLSYSLTLCCGPRQTFLENAIAGNSLLRARVSWALQTFVVQQGLYLQQTLAPWQNKMEMDAFGNFQQVLQDAASDCSMGLFMNLVGNLASNDPNSHPNQNFARETMQLFSLGDVMLNDDGTAQLDSSGSPIPSYDQATIIDLSRVFTGWDCDHTPDPSLTPFGCNYGLPLVDLEWAHDHGQKTLFGGVVLPAGQDAVTDRNMAIQAIFNHQNVPPFVSRIMIQRLVKSNPSPAFVGRMSAVFKNDGSGVRGNMAALVRAILLDPEARSGDTSPAADDGFLQEPLLWETFGMSLLQMEQMDGQPTYTPGVLGEEFDYSPTVFGYYSPAYDIPGTTINSPEFMLLNNLSIIQRSQLWWGMIQGNVQGFSRQPNYLYQTFTTVPDMLDALNHLLYHGKMSADEQAAIATYCMNSGLGLQAQLDLAIFLAGNADSYNVSQ